MNRRVAYIPGFAVLCAIAFAVPARAATCPELQLSPDSNVKQVGAGLDGKQVVTSSGTTGAGDPDGTGTLVLTFLSQDTKNANVSYQIDTTDVAVPLEGAHIHKAAPGKTGLAAVTIFGFTDQPDRSGTVTMSKCLAHDIFNQPADYYVDVHNDEYPDQGAIRGQLASIR